jgi:quercetin dioxygenase-like cupin family protein
MREDAGRAREFFLGHGFDRISGPEAAVVGDFREELGRRRERLALTGNLYEPRVRADFPGSECLLPVNWLLMPERKFDYVLLRARPGEAFPRHRHGYGEELYVVIAGEGTVFIAEEAHPARVHDVFHIPAGVLHGYAASPETTETFDILCINAPAVDQDLRSRYWSVDVEEGEETR